MVNVVKDVSAHLIQWDTACIINCELQIMLLGFRWEDLGMCLKRHISMETNLNENSVQPRDVSPTAASWKVQNLLPREEWAPVDFQQGYGCFSENPDSCYIDWQEYRFSYSLCIYVSSEAKTDKRISCRQGLYVP